MIPSVICSPERSWHLALILLLWLPGHLRGEAGQLEPGPRPRAHSASGFPAPQEAETPILVLAAASLTDVLPQVASLWEKEGGNPVRFSFGATSRLAPQILQGVKADLFFSADEAWMDWLEERGGIEPKSRVTLLSNDLVLVVPEGGRFVPPEAEALASPRIRRLALAGENVPAGRYGRAALESTGAWERVAERVIRAGSVRGALEWVARGEVEAAVVYRTDALSEPRARIAFSFPRDSHPPISYPVAVIRGVGTSEAAGRFLAFCSSPRARAIFEAEGFRPLEPHGTSTEEGSPPSWTPNPWSAIRLSLLVALGATLAGFIPSVWLGWVLARKEFFGKSVIATLALAPLVLPPVVTGFLLLSVFGARGPLGGLLEGLGIPVPFTLFGATLAALAVGFPLYVVSIRNAFQVVDPRYEEVSWTLGRRPWPTFLKVTFPLAIPGIAAGAILAFARALGEFGATVVLAGNVEGQTRTIALAVYTLLESPEGREAIWLLVGASALLSLLALLGFEALSRRQRHRMESRHAR